MNRLRSMLFTPGNRIDLISKALDGQADAVIVDLEDSVPDRLKEQARHNLAHIPDSSMPVYVRVNAADTPWFWQDVIAAGSMACGIVVPKAEDARLIGLLDGALTCLEVQAGREIGSISIIPLIESSLGVLRAEQIISASTRVKSILFGSGEQGDLVANLECEWTPDGTALTPARAMVLLAARALGVEQPMDAVFMDFRNLEGLRTECELAKRIGYTGKVAIHPAQLPVIHEVFSPSAAEIVEQRRILALFEQAVLSGAASIDVDGRMVDYAVANRAKNIIARAEALVKDVRR